MACNIHPFIPQIHASTFEIGWQGKLVQHRQAFHRFSVRDILEFDSDLCSVLCMLEEKEKKRKKK
jgi:hypothetical protein